MHLGRPTTASRRTAFNENAVMCDACIRLSMSNPLDNCLEHTKQCCYMTGRPFALLSEDEVL